VAAAASALLVYAELLAHSRGGYLGLGAALVVLVAVGWRRERLAGWAIVIGAPLLVVAWVTHLIPRSVQASVLNQVGSFQLDDAALCGHVNDANYSALERLDHWVAGLRMFAAHPLLGVGAGNYDQAYARYAASCWPDALGHAHNYYINAAAETGVLGLLAFLALTGAALVAGWRATHVPAGSGRLAPSPQVQMARVFALGFFAAIVTLIVHNLTDNLFVHAIELQFALSLGALLWLRAFQAGQAEQVAPTVQDIQLGESAQSEQAPPGIQSVLPAGGD
jgi:O-antigen ligase